MAAENVLSTHYKELIANPSTVINSVRVLQQHWQVWKARKTRDDAKDKLDVLHDMVQSTEQNIRVSDKVKVIKKGEKIREAEYETMKQSLEKTFLSSDEANFDRWALQLNIMQWILELRDLFGKFSQYPDDEQEGCNMLFTNKTVKQVAQELQDLEEDDKKKKPKDKEEKKKGKKNKEDGKKKKKDKEEGFVWTMPRSDILPGLVQALGEYNQYWNLKTESQNREQRPDLQLCKEKIRAEAQDSIRKSVDAMMRAELDRLRVVDRERPPKHQKKAKSKKKQKKRGKKDPLGGRSVEELFAELVLHNIVGRPQQVPVTLDNFLGAPNLSDADRVTCRMATPPDIKMVIREMFGLPLTSSVIHTSLQLRK
ncbi:Iq and aaa domain-containing protein 1 [Plakobranchus ocellatus]|uniref:Iq and aaa domain-containing protein 1 n=1 Tax=Plakobranchus ocellatus TaxID=259542 RepID=A0AAV3Y7S8_9GAST|nr:Iq and aaa domain-containing protein 1 [Plakobranchus ocellatus]